MSLKYFATLNAAEVADIDGGDGVKDECGRLGNRCRRGRFVIEGSDNVWVDSVLKRRFVEVDKGSVRVVAHWRVAITFPTRNMWDEGVGGVVDILHPGGNRVGVAEKINTHCGRETTL